MDEILIEIEKINEIKVIIQNQIDKIKNNLLQKNIKLNKWCNKTLITYDYESKNNKITISCK